MATREKAVTSFTLHRCIAGDSSYLTLFRPGYLNKVLLKIIIRDEYAGWDLVPGSVEHISEREHLAQVRHMRRNW